MNIINAINTLYNYPRRLRGQRIARQIAQLHPELDAYQGEAKIRVYTLLAHKLPSDGRDFLPHQKPDFNDGAEQADPQLRYRALDFMSVRLVFNLQAKLLIALGETNNLTRQNETLTGQNQTLTQQNQAQQARIDRLNELVQEFRKVAKEADQTIREINRATKPEYRQN